MNDESGQIGVLEFALCFVLLGTVSVILGAAEGITIAGRWIGRKLRIVQ